MQPRIFLEQRLTALLNILDRSENAEALVKRLRIGIKKYRFHRRCKDTYAYIASFLQNPGIDSLLVQFYGSRSSEVEPREIPGYWQLNPTVFISNGRIALCWRATNGVFLPEADNLGRMRLEKSSPQIRNQILIGDLDENFKLTNQRKIHDSIGVPSFEDPRGFDSKTSDFVVGTIVTEEPVQGIGKWRSNVGILHIPSGQIRVFPNPAGKQIEKNWVPISIDQSRIKLLYSTSPQVIVEVDPVTFEVNFYSESVASDIPNLSGGSQFVRIPSGHFLRVARRRFPVEGKGLVHFSYLLLYDKNLHPIKISRPFIFRKFGFEICNGLMLTNDGSVFFSWGEDDRKLYVMSATLSEVLSWLESNESYKLRRNKTRRGQKSARGLLRS